MKYFRDQDFVIDGIKLFYKNALFDGKGFMRWRNQEGFDIDLFVESEEYQEPKVEGFGSDKVIKNKERKDIYLSLAGYKKGIIKNIYLDNQLSIDLTGTLSLRSPHLVFLKSNKFQKESKYYSGSCIYKLKKKKYVFPEVVQKEEKIGGDELRKGGGKRGIQYKNEDGYFKGWIEDEKFLHLRFGFSKSMYKQSFALNFPCGFRNALSSILGIEAKRLKSEVNGRNSKVIVMEKLTEIKNMPVYNGLHSFQSFKSKTLWKLAMFFTKGYLDKNRYLESYVAQRILDQLIEAEQQKTFIAQELLTATILEAALRSLHGIPFLPDSNSNFGTDYYLKNKFIPKYADGKKWRKVRKEIIKCFNRVRHRNAHPDWLTEEFNAYEDKNIDNTFHDLRKLIKFYQQMILLMSGINNENIEAKLAERL